VWEARPRGSRSEVTIESRVAEAALDAHTLPFPLPGPDELLRRIQESGLRGRGGGWFPTARKWQAVRAESGDATVVANGAEGEPGSIKDRFVMTRRPEAVLAGLAAAAKAVSARQAVVYLKASFRDAAAALRAALPAIRTGDLDVEIRLGDESYVGGEETAILEVLEGRRAWPRPKPPLPAAAGLHGRPTLVQNVETLARVPAALADPAAFRKAETTLVTVWGDVARPGVYEVALGTPIRAVVDTFGGGAPDGIGMVFPAGPSAPPLPAALADTPLEPSALREVGSALGTASLLIVGASRCPLSVAESLARFFERESCGQCPPCSVGTASLSRFAAGFETGSGRVKDVSDVAEAAGFMAIHGYCAHCRTAAASVRGLLERFGCEVDAHIRGSGCPRPHGRFRPFDADSPARAAIEAVARGFARTLEPGASAAAP
jgi:NADH:ubiquinone oxidoreductase subunit F (NADH-binding)